MNANYLKFKVKYNRTPLRQWFSCVPLEGASVTLWHQIWRKIDLDTPKKDSRHPLRWKRIDERHHINATVPRHQPGTIWARSLRASCLLCMALARNDDWLRRRCLRNPLTMDFASKSGYYLCGPALARCHLEARWLVIHHALSFSVAH